MTIRLANCSTHSDRFIKRLMPAKEFKKNGQWCLEITSDPQKCLELVNHPISTEKETGDIIYQWQFSPQKSGLALVRATYTSCSRAAPLIQEFLVTIE